MWHPGLMIDVLGGVFYACLLCGTYLLGMKKWYGWPMRVAGDIGWLVVGHWIGLYSVMVFSVLFMVIDVRGWWKWTSPSGAKKEIDDVLKRCEATLRSVERR